MTIATGDSVTLEYTGRLDDETVFDTSRKSVAEETGLAEAQPDREYAPLTVEIGDEQIIEGMEEGLIGLEAGETETLTIPPEKAYGEPSDENIQEFETEELREMLGGQTPEEGSYLEAQNGSQRRLSTSTRRLSGGFQSSSRRRNVDVRRRNHRRQLR